MGIVTGDDVLLYVAATSATLPTTGWGLVNAQTKLSEKKTRSTRAIKHKSLQNGIEQTLFGKTRSLSVEIAGYYDDADANGLDIIETALAGAAPIVWVYVEKNAAGTKGFTMKAAVSEGPNITADVDTEAEYSLTLSHYSDYVATTARPTGIAGSA